MLKAAARLPLKRQGPRALAVLAFLYLLSAFIQSGYVTPTQIIGGVLWLLLCYMLSQRLGIVTVPGAELRNLSPLGDRSRKCPYTRLLQFQQVCLPSEFGGLLTAVLLEIRAYRGVLRRLSLAPGIGTCYWLHSVRRGMDGWCRIRLQDDTSLYRRSTNGQVHKFRLGSMPRVRDFLYDAQFRAGIFSLVGDLRLADLETFDSQRSLSLSLCGLRAGDGCPIPNTDERNLGTPYMPSRNRCREGSVSAKVRSGLRCI